MYYKYVAYNETGEVVTGKLTAFSEESANELLNYAGYQAISLKESVPFFGGGNLFSGLFKVKPTDVIIFYRQLAILLESGNDISTSLEMLKNQTENRSMRKALEEIIDGVREGSPLSAVTRNYPQIFPQMHTRLLNIGEQSGNLETVLVQIADDMEREVETAKETKNALTAPFITFGLTVVVLGVMLNFVLPSYSTLYTSLGVELPTMTKIMLNISNFTKDNSLYLSLGGLVVIMGIYAYLKTEKGKYNWDKMLLKIPYLGKVRHLIELSKCCRSLSVLFKSGLSLTEAIPLIEKSCSNRAIASGFAEVHERMVRGEGLSAPMATSRFFLPLMVQMVKVGEESGNLDVTLMTVSNSYSAEAGYKLKSVVALIQPAMTIIIGLVIAGVALSMTSALYGIYGGF